MMVKNKNMKKKLYTDCIVCWRAPKVIGNHCEGCDAICKLLQVIHARDLSRISEDQRRNPEARDRRIQLYQLRASAELPLFDDPLLIG